MTNGAPQAEFNLESPMADDYEPVGQLNDLPVGRVVAVSRGGHDICVLRRGEDEVIAFNDRCPHRGHPLSKGTVDGKVLRCALHGWEFDTATGEAVSPRSPFCLDLLPIHTDLDGEVHVRLAGEPAEVA